MVGASVGQLVVLAAGISAAGVIWKRGILPAYRNAKAAAHTVKRVTLAADRLIPFAEEQLRTNGGSTLADKIDNIAVNHAIAVRHWTILEKGQETAEIERGKIADRLSHAEIVLEAQAVTLATVAEAHHHEVTERLSAIEHKSTPTIEANVKLEVVDLLKGPG